VLACQFCGGKTCKLENWLKVKNPAVKGLNSNWINSEIVASQRLSSRLIKEFDLMKSFKDQKIHTVINLQEPGEHASCGDGILKKSGFSYDPEELYENNVQFFNYNWPDFGGTDPDMILRVVKTIDVCLDQKKEEGSSKVLVHCHAGRGRTGIIICSTLIYRNKMRPEEAIELFRKNREGKCLDSKKQQRCVYEFDEYILALNKSFDHDFTLETLIKNQNKFYNFRADDFEKKVPKVVVDIFAQFGKLKIEGKLSPKTFLSCFFDGSVEIEGRHYTWNNSLEGQLQTIKQN
jgi:protein tyrosine phosphatase domain-containing protein 1